MWYASSTQPTAFLKATLLCIHPQKSDSKSPVSTKHFLADGADAAATETIGGEVARGYVGILEIEFQAPGLDGIGAIDG